MREVYKDFRKVKTQGDNVCPMLLFYTSFICHPWLQCHTVILIEAKLKHFPKQWQMFYLLPSVWYNNIDECICFRSFFTLPLFFE